MQTTDPVNAIYEAAWDRFPKGKSIRERYNAALELRELCESNPRLNEILCYPRENLWRKLTRRDGGTLKSATVQGYLDSLYPEVVKDNILKAQRNGTIYKYIDKIVEGQDLIALSLLPRKYIDYVNYRSGLSDLAQVLKKSLVDNDYQKLDAVYENGQIENYLRSLTDAQLSGFVLDLSKVSNTPEKRVLLRRILDSWDRWKPEHFQQALAYARQIRSKPLETVFGNMLVRFPGNTRRIL